MQARSQPEPRLDIVIVNWNSGALLQACVRALDESSIAEALKIIVVDNASSDRSLDGVTATRATLEIISNRTNRGFAAASNTGATQGHADTLLFLNPDVQVARDTLAHTIAYLDDPKYADVGIVGAQLHDPGGTIQRTCARMPTTGAWLLHTLFLDRFFPSLAPPLFLLEWDHGDTREVDHVIGAYLAIRRPLFRKLGGFDERYFVYYEDLDLCVAARRAGWKIVYDTGARAEHIGGGTTSAIKYRRLFYSLRSRIQFMAKHKGFIPAALLAFLMIFAEIPIRLVFHLAGDWTADSARPGQTADRRQK